MPAPDSAIEATRLETEIGLAVARELIRLWREVPIRNVDRWARSLDLASITVAGGQLEAANIGGGYVAAVTTEQGINPARVADPVPRAFAGTAADGRTLDGLLLQPVIVAKNATRDGETPQRAHRIAEASLVNIATSEIADAARASIVTTMVATPAVTGYVRCVSAGACDLCRVIAGKFYAYNAGFQRHFHCHCTHVPTTRDRYRQAMTDPTDEFQAMTRIQQDATYGADRAALIREGRPIAEVVPIRRSMVTAADTARGPRPMPELLITTAGSRDEALAALTANGYLAAA